MLGEGVVDMSLELGRLGLVQIGGRLDKSLGGWEMEKERGNLDRRRFPSRVTSIQTF